MKSLCRAIAKYGEKKKIAVYKYSRRDIKDTFAQVGATNKHMINCAIVRIIPVLEASQPDERKQYNAEVSEQGPFDAAALGMVFFARIKRFDIAKAMPDGMAVIEA